MIVLLLSCASPPTPAPAETPDPSPGPPAPTPIRVHVTVDDLPWQIERDQTMLLTAGQTRTWNDRLRAVFDSRGVKASVFFTCSRLQEDGLVAAWAEAGHTVGNHTAHHVPAKGVGVDAFLADARECQDRLLQEVDSVPWFRYPYLGYGRDRADQDRIRDGLAAMGLTNAPVTVPDAEYVFAFQYRHALADGDVPRQEALAAAYRTHMDDALAAAVDLAVHVEGHDIPQTVLVHVNELNVHHLGGILDTWKARGVELVSLPDAMADPVFQRPPTRDDDGAVAWVVRSHPGEFTDWDRYWFGEEEGRVRRTWGFDEPEGGWHRGVPPEP
ncbi:MAG: polysaccharide deacetylase family protein [Myxococcota bacterium]